MIILNTLKIISQTFADIIPIPNAIFANYLIINLILSIILELICNTLRLLDIKINKLFSKLLISCLTKWKKTVFIVRLKMNIKRVLYYGYSRSSTAARNENNDFNTALNTKSLTSLFVQLLEYCFSFNPRNIICLILVISPWYGLVDVSRYIETILIYFNNFNITKFEQLLNIVAPVLGVSVIFFSWRYTGTRGLILRGINQSNKNQLDSIIMFFRKLSELMIDILPYATNNIEYAVMNIESIADDYIESINENVYCSLGKIEYKKYGVKCKFNFGDYSKPISNLGVFENMIIDASNKGYYYQLPYFLRMNYKLIGFYKIPVFGDINNIKSSLEITFMTPLGLKSLYNLNCIIKERIDKIIASNLSDQDKKQDIENLLNDHRKLFKERLTKQLVDSIECTIYLSEFTNKCLKLLHIDSNRLNKAVSFIINKE